MFKKLDHIAIAVKNTENQIPFWQQEMGGKIEVQEVVNNQTVQLTHINVGGTQIQLVQPLNPEHPIAQWVEKFGEGLHHICFFAEDFDAALKYARENNLVSKEVMPHQGTQGKKAFFLNKEKTNNILIEITG